MVTFSAAACSPARVCSCKGPLPVAWGCEVMVGFYPTGRSIMGTSSVPGCDDGGSTQTRRSSHELTRAVS